jgi:hypothetical protein
LTRRDIGKGIGLELSRGLLSPALAHLLDVVRQNALEVVGGIELVGVADAGEGHVLSVLRRRLGYRVIREADEAREARAALQCGA